MSIVYHGETKTFLLQTPASVYAFKIGGGGAVIHLFWGGKTEHIGDLPTEEELAQTTTLASVEKDDCREYADWGRYSFIEPSLKARFSDRTRDLWLGYRSHVIENHHDFDLLTLELSDAQYPIAVTLVYKVFHALDIIERNAVIKNSGRDDIFIERAFSATYFLPRRDSYRLTNLAGAWAGEYRIQRQNLPQTQIVMQSRTGLSGPEFAPVFMLDENAAATEKTGAVYFGALIWSGNWKILVEKDSQNRTIVSGGISDFDFEWDLKAGERFETPVFACGRTEGGFGGASRTLHDYERAYIMPETERTREIPVVYNAYGTFLSQINQEKIMGVVDKAADLGAELFVIDSGWTGGGDDTTYGYRNGFGDWTVNRDRFPDGLKPVADKAHRRGMKFGIWMEPEAVSPNSALFRAHPEWIHRFDGRPPYEISHRYILNFAVDEAADYMTDKIISLIRDYDLDYFKMDFCRLANVMAWQGCEDSRQKEVWVRHIHNLYKCYDAVKKRFPGLLIENCASGGYRADLGMLRFSGRMNRSDNQDPLDILKIHEGFSYFLPPKLAGGGCLISDMFTRHINARTSPMRFQAHAAMMGSLAVGKDLSAITREEAKALAGYISLYKEIRPIVHFGDVFRIASAREKPYAAFFYVSKDKSEAVLFVFSQAMQFAKMPERFRLDGLEKDAAYDVEGFGVRSGGGLMNVGLQIPLRGDMDSRVIRLKRM